MRPYVRGGRRARSASKESTFDSEGEHVRARRRARSSPKQCTFGAENPLLRTRNPTASLKKLFDVLYMTVCCVCEMKAHIPSLQISEKQIIFFAGGIIPTFMAYTLPK